MHFCVSVFSYVDDEWLNCPRKNFLWTATTKQALITLKRTVASTENNMSTNWDTGFVHFTKILSLHIWQGWSYRVVTRPETVSDDWRVRRIWHLFAYILISPPICSSSHPVYPLLHLPTPSYSKNSSCPQAVTPVFSFSCQSSSHSTAQAWLPQQTRRFGRFCVSCSSPFLVMAATCTAEPWEVWDTTS